MTATTTSPWHPPLRATRLTGVTLVEDEPLFRHLLRHALERTGVCRVLDSVGTVSDALASSAIAQSDAVLLDIDLRGEDGLRLGRDLRARHPHLGIVLLSNHAHLAFARSLIAAHLTGWAYLLKKSVADVHSIVRAVDGVRHGGVVLDPRLMHASPLEAPCYAHLTPRQWSLWQLITQGFSNGAIADHLGLSAKSVDNAVGGLYAALGIDTKDVTFNARVSAALLYAREASELPATGESVTWRMAR